MLVEAETIVYREILERAEERFAAAEAEALRLEEEQRVLLAQLREARHAFHLAFLERAEVRAVLRQVGFPEEQILAVRRQVQQQEVQRG